MNVKPSPEPSIVDNESSFEKSQVYAADEKRRLSFMQRGPWFSVIVLTIASAFAYVDRQILGLLIEPVRVDLNLTDTQISILVGFAFVIFHALFRHR